MTLRGVRTMDVISSTQTGVQSIPATPLTSGRMQVSIVANHANHILPSAYFFGAE